MLERFLFLLWLLLLLLVLFWLKLLTVMSVFWFFVMAKTAFKEAQKVLQFTVGDFFGNLNLNQVNKFPSHKICC